MTWRQYLLPTTLLWLPAKNEEHIASDGSPGPSNYAATGGPLIIDLSEDDDDDDMQDGLESTHCSTSDGRTRMSNVGDGLPAAPVLLEIAEGIVDNRIAEAINGMTENKIEILPRQMANHWEHRFDEITECKINAFWQSVIDDMKCRIEEVAGKVIERKIAGLQQIVK